MENAVSLFNGGVSLQLDTLDQQAREEEEEDKEEARRIDAELAQKLEGAFDDLDFDDDDDSSLCSPPGAPARTAVTPGQTVGLDQYMTSTPYMASDHLYGQTPQYQQFHQLAVEETNAETPYVGRIDREDLAFSDQLNKSDSEKVLERKKIVGVTFKQDDLEVLYNARGRELNRLETELEDKKTEFETEIRQLRHQLALTRAESMNSVSNSEQLNQVVSDQRRENKILTQEIHQQNQKIKDLENDRDSLEKELEGNKCVLDQLQRQLVELQSSDTVLRARQQHDATVRSLQERHTGEVSKLQSELDQNKGRAATLETENRSLSTRLSSALAEYDTAVKSKANEISKLHNQIHAERDNKSDQARLQGELSAVTRQLEGERDMGRKLVTEVEQLRGELSALEALAREQVEHSDSMVQLGLSGAEQGSHGGGSSSQRIREELHRSLVGNRTKREEINRLEVVLRKKDEELRQGKSKEEQLLKEIEDVRSAVGKFKEQASVESKELVERLQNDGRNLASQNIELKKHISEIVTGNDADKQEAIDELREEYEENVREAVEETKQLMEGEVHRLRIELDVYSKTLQEVRSKQSNVMEENKDLLQNIEKLQKVIDEKEKHIISKLVSEDVSHNEKDVMRRALESEIMATKEAEISSRLVEAHKTIEKNVCTSKELEFESRIQKVKSDMRAIWETEMVVRVEEGVSKARLDWIKRLPEIEKAGGAARESLGELEAIRQVVLKERKAKEDFESKFKEYEVEIRRLGNRERELEKQIEEVKREGRREAEERLGQELREALVRQQEQWERIVRSSREEAEEQRRQVGKQWESQVEVLEGRLNLVSDEKLRLETKEKDMSLALQKWKGDVMDKQKLLENMKEEVKRREEFLGKKNNTDIKLLKEELERRGSEVNRQREEMAGLVNKWRDEVSNIQSTHEQERKELDDVREKYKQLKAKVRRYQRHVENKEDHYKGEYARLESEFRQTLERLRGRMEAAYTEKEAQVELELGEMRNQLSSELRRVVEAKNAIDEHPVMEPVRDVGVKM